MTYAIEQRLRLIDFLLAHYGRVNRGAIMDYFGISTPQASLDLQAYRQMAPDNLSYDGGAKAYVRGEKFTRIYP